MSSSILVVGGAGYIGSHMAKMLMQSGHDILVLDNLSTGFRDAVRYGRFIEGDLTDRYLLDRMFAENSIDAVLHFAALSQVGESIQKPALYYRNNVTNTLNLLDAMLAHGVQRFIFSSTAAIFGEPETARIAETHPQRPINPYGRSKRMVEEILKDYDQAYGLRYVSLRYFNAAGADPEGEMGERHDPESHLIPLVLQAASGRKAQIVVYGDDYPTPDGTCIRDYVHVWDLCSAHLLALEHLLAGGESKVFNLGNGGGFSVQAVIDAARRVTGKTIPNMVQERRAGDPAVLVADRSRALETLGWVPRFDGIDTIIAHAWEWEQKHETV
ncbi:MAG: UDP-glucose 4-epimerase GalE [Acidithiobacillus sp.]|nr:UDP-glucose 4-epimerase GalE [Acidithiobacillus sp.]